MGVLKLGMVRLLLEVSFNASPARRDTGPALLADHHLVHRVIDEVHLGL